MEKKGKRIFYMMLAAIIAISGIGFNRSIVKAAVQWGNPINTGYYWAESGEISIMSVNGNHAYCLEPNKYVSTTSGYQEQEHNFTKEQWNKLVMIAHFGYNKDKKSNADYAAAQIMIWRQIWIWKGIEPAPINDTNVPDLKGKIAAIEQSIKEYETMLKNRPHFNDGINVVSGKEMRIKDENNAIGKYPYYVASATKGITASIDDKNNELVIRAQKGMPLQGEIILKIQEENLIKKNRFYYHKSSQNVGNIGFLADVNVKIPITVDNKGDAKITKISESGKPIRGAEFEITAVDDMFKKTYITDEHGIFLAEDLTEGAYTVKEISVPRPYILDKEEKNITVIAGETAEVEFTNDMPRGEFTLKKIDEYGEKLQDAEFEIYSEGSDAEGNEIGFREVFTTDEDGMIKVKGLKPGIYFYKEIKAPDGFLQDDKIYDFSIEYQDSVTAVIKGEKEVINKEPRGSISLVKDFAEDENISQQEKEAATLAGAVYGLYAKDDIKSKSGAKEFFKKGEKVGEFITDENGISKPVIGLPMGKYYVKELKAPKGCKLDNEEHEIKLSYKDQKTESIEAVLNVTDEIEKQKAKVVRTVDSFPLGTVMAFTATALLGTCFAAIRRKNK